MKSMYRSFIRGNLAIALGFGALSASAVTYYVGPDGDDGNAGTSPATAFYGIPAALAKDDVTEIRVLAGDWAPTTMKTTIKDMSDSEWLGVVTKGVKILGAGRGQTILHCNNGGSTTWSSAAKCNRGGFYIDNADAEVSGLTVVGAFHCSTSARGIGVVMPRGTIGECDIINMPATDQNRAALYMGSGATATDCAITNNNIGYNGKIPPVYCAGTLVRCLVANNQTGDSVTANGLGLAGGKAIGCVVHSNAGYNSSISAGGVYMAANSELEDSIISNNVIRSVTTGAKSHSAAGVCVDGSGCKVTGCVIRGNATYSSNQQTHGGLSITSSGKNAVVSGTTVEDNFCGSNGELYVGVNTAQVSDCTIRNRKGKLLTELVAGVTLTGCTLDDGSTTPDTRPAVCYVAPEGSGSATPPYDNSTKATPDLQAAIDAVRNGGKVIVAAGTYTDTSPIVERKRATGVRVFVDKAVTVEGPADPTTARFICNGNVTTFVQKYCAGAGFYVAHPKAVISGLTITAIYTGGNIEDFNCGAALQLDAGVVSNCCVSGSTATGGGHCNTTVGIAGGTMTHCEISDSYSSSCWGRGCQGLTILSGLFMKGRILRNGIATAMADQATANGLHLKGGVVCDSIIEGNFGGMTKASCAAGVTLDGGVLERCIVQCNTNNAGSSGTAATQAGGVYVAKNAVLRNCFIAGNRALTTSTTSAGGIYAASGATVSHVTLVENASSAGAQGAYLANGTSMKGSIVVNAVGTPVHSASGTAGVWTDNIVFGETGVTLPVTWETVGGYAISAASAGYNAVTENLVTDDLLGVARPVIEAGSEDFPDAGAMEKIGPKKGEITANPSPASATIRVGSQQAFEVVLDGAVTTVGTCTWTVEHAGTNAVYEVTGKNFTFIPDGVGDYTLRLVAQNTDGDVAPEKIVPVSVKPGVCYVAPEADSVWPYATRDTAATNLADAIDAVYAVAGDPGRVIVAPGVYAGLKEMSAANGLTYVGVLDRAVEVIAEAGPERTSVSFKSKDLGGGFLVSDDDACLSGFTVSGTVLKATADTWSANAIALVMSKGVVSNCVFTGCSVGYDGGVTGHNLEPVLLTGGVMTHCQVVRNVLDAKHGRASCGIYMTGGTVTDSLVAGNTIPANWGDLTRAGGIFLAGGEVIRTTVVSNFNCTVNGNATGGAGGVYVTGGTIRDSLIAYNTDASARSTRVAGGLAMDEASHAAPVVGSAVNVTVARNVQQGEKGAPSQVSLYRGTIKNAILHDGSEANAFENVNGTVTYSCFKNAAGDGNIPDSPGFKRRNLTIGMSSPCAKAGEDGTYMGYAPPYPDGLMLLIR